MVNYNRMGANYALYHGDTKRLVFNKVLFFVAVVLLYLLNRVYADCILLIVMSVPIIKKCIVSIMDRYYYSEYALVLSGAVLLIALDGMHTVALMLAIYHVYDFVVYIIYNRALSKFLDNSLIFENAINYRLTKDGNYILSNNEYIPAEGTVVSGEAMVDFSRISGEKDDIVPVYSGAKLFPACRIVKGNILYSPLNSEKKSILPSLNKVYSDTMQRKTENTAVKIFDILKLVLTILFLAASAVFLFADFNFDITFWITPAVFLGCTSLLYVFINAFEYRFISKLQQRGIYIINPDAKKEVLEKEQLFENTNFSKYQIFSYTLKKEEAYKEFTLCKKKYTDKCRLLGILAIVNIAAICISAVIMTQIPMYISLVGIVSTLALISEV